jgi:dihydrolipoamide dehydrogenase
MVGPWVEHLAHLVAWSVPQGHTVEHMLGMPFYHRSSRRPCRMR